MIELKNINIGYRDKLLEKTSCFFRSGEISLIRGVSGKGKSSLLYRIGLIDTDVDVLYDGKSIQNLKKSEIDQIRREKIGFVLQESEIIAHLNVEENLEHYALLVHQALTKQEIRDILAKVDLDVPLEQDVMTLSLGQRQRLAIACALVKDPEILILDEPTASLDSENERIVFEILKQLADEGRTLIVASHSDMAVQYAHRIYEIKDKKLMLEKDEDRKITPYHSLSSSIHPHFFKHYARNYLPKYRWNYILMMLVASLVLILSGFVNLYFENQIEKNKVLLYQQFDKQLFITENKDLTHIKDIFMVKEWKDLKENEYPFIKMKLNVDEEIYVIPYFDENDLSDRIDVQISNQGIYVSQEAIRYLGDQYRELNAKMYVSLLVWTMENDMPVYQEVSSFLPVGGILKSGVANFYNYKDKAFIYMYYQDMMDLYHLVSQDETYIGYTALFDDYDQLKAYKAKMESQGLGVNDSFIHIEAIDAMIESYLNLQKKVSVALYISGWIILSVLNIHLFSKRKKEMSILKMNGVTTMELLKIFGYEYVWMSLGVLSVSEVVLLLCQWWFMGSWLVLVIPIFYLLSILLVVLLFYAWQLSRLSIESVLRDIQ